MFRGFKKAWRKYRGSHKPSFDRSDRIVRQRIANSMTRNKKLARALRH